MFIYPKIFFISSSGVDIGVNANLSTNISNTFLDKNAGKEGPI